MSETAEAVVEGSKENPANRPGKTDAQRKRIPLSTPVQKLEVPDIPGYVLYWFRGDAGRINQALRGGYEYVRPDEVAVNNVSLGSNPVMTGNTDMGDIVSVSAGGTGDDGQASRLVLMKIKKEWYDEDRIDLENRNEQVAAALRGDEAFQKAKVGEIGDAAFDAEGTAGNANPGDPTGRYARKTAKVPDLFRRKT